VVSVVPGGQCGPDDSGGLPLLESSTFGMYDCGVARTTLRAKGQLTLPDEIRKAAHLEEGDLLDAELTSEGILLRPQKLIDATQAWFWSPQWQQGERAADTDRAAGRVETFGSDEEFLAALRGRAKRPRRQSPK
jgi:AbrB family looped-hinge helix DNA binding protein